MSAWIVSKKHIDLLVTAAQSAKYMRVEDPTALGTLLWAENHKSVNARYSEESVTPPYRFARFPGKVDPIVVLKSIHCYQYQACEHDGWKESEACKLMTELEGEMISALPGYDAAPWGIGND